MSPATRIKTKGKPMDKQTNNAFCINVAANKLVQSTWTVDEVNPLHQGDVLPDLGFSGDRRYVANFFRP